MKQLYFLCFLCFALTTGCNSNDSGNSSRDGKIDKTVIIGDKTWMAENLNVDKFRNGDLIPEAKTNSEWKEACIKKIPAWCYYDYNPTYEEGYGKLYNWFAVNDPRGLAPVGWRVPSENDWKELVQFLGYDYNSRVDFSEVAPKLKAGRDWKKGETNNSSGFFALPGGHNSIGGFNHIKESGHWWSSTEANRTGAKAFKLYANSNSFNLDADYKTHGKSVRCVKD
jgi:uncharacterized protein (TIGR02145 family)